MCVLRDSVGACVVGGLGGGWVAGFLSVGVQQSSNLLKAKNTHSYNIPPFINTVVSEGFPRYIMVQKNKYIDG